MGQYVQLGQGGEDRKEADGEWQQRGHEAAERQDQQDHRDRDGDALGESEVFGHLGVDVRAQCATDFHRHCAVVEVRIIGQHGGGRFRRGGVVADHVGQD
jgi:hypothetical protein